MSSVVTAAPAAAPAAATADDAALPGLLRSFVAYFTRYIDEKNVAEIHSIYENSFPKLTERFYKTSPWPTLAQVTPLLGEERLPALLYKELYFRHVFSRLSPTLADRMQSWANYLELFGWLLEKPKQFRLPHSWLFDLIDEFVWQAQSFNHFRNKVKALSNHDKATLTANPDLWSVVSVLRMLEKLVESSGVRAFLATNTSGRTEAALIHEDGDSSANDFLALGYFSLVGLLRMHCLMGDYYTALQQTRDFKVLARDGGSDELFFGSAITPCDITLYYYTGFCNLMLKRYDLVTDLFSKILLFLASTKQLHQRSTSQFEIIAKKQEQMISLLAVAMCMSPLASQFAEVGVLDEILKEKHADALVRLRRGDSTAAFEELYVQACPKFISASNAPLDTPVNVHLEPLRFQQALFLAEVKQQSRIPVIRSFLKLYSTIGLAKLASFLQCDVDSLRSQLLSYKSKADAERGQSDIGFYLDCDMICVIETKSRHTFIDPLLDGISKANSVLVATSSKRSN